MIQTRGLRSCTALYHPVFAEPHPVWAMQISLLTKACTYILLNNISLKNTLDFSKEADKSCGNFHCAKQKIKNKKWHWVWKATQKCNEAAFWPFKNWMSKKLTFKPTWTRGPQHLRFYGKWVNSCGTNKWSLSRVVLGVILHCLMCRVHLFFLYPACMCILLELDMQG